MVEDHDDDGVMVQLHTVHTVGRQEAAGQTRLGEEANTILRHK